VDAIPVSCQQLVIRGLILLPFEIFPFETSLPETHEYVSNHPSRAPPA
jgi:hypothetical protein